MGVVGNATANLRSPFFKGQVNAIASRGSDLYVGGNFMYAGSLLVDDVVHWDGNEWRSLGGQGPNSSNASILAMAIDSGGRLFIGGSFTQVGTLSVKNIAYWDEQRWRSPGRANGLVCALLADGQGNVYAGGEFTSVGGVTVNRVCRFDGTRWNTLGSGTSGPVRTLCLGSDGSLVAGGDFRNAGGVTADRVAKWNGSGWSPLGAGFNEQVTSLVVDQRESDTLKCHIIHRPLRLRRRAGAGNGVWGHPGGAGRYPII